MAFERDLRIPANKLEGRVYLQTGLAYTQKRQKAIREEDQRMALERLNAAGCAEAKELMLYLNTLPSGLRATDGAVIAPFWLPRDDCTVV